MRGSVGANQCDQNSEASSAMSGGVGQHPTKARATRTTSSVSSCSNPASRSLSSCAVTVTPMFSRPIHRACRSCHQDARIYPASLLTVGLRSAASRPGSSTFSDGPGRGLGPRRQQRCAARKDSVLSARERRGRTVRTCRSRPRGRRPALWSSPPAVESQKSLQPLLVAEPADRHASLLFEYPAQVRGA